MFHFNLRFTIYPLMAFKFETFFTDNLKTYGLIDL